jgi:dihydrofolate reductase
MQKLRVHNLSMSVDGYVAGPDQTLEDPLGVGGSRLHEWVFATRTGRRMIGEDGGDEDIDDQFMAEGEVGIGATIMGRNMFGPIRGDWDDEQWKGWWGDNPPFHHPVFVLTHHPRAPVEMEGGTTFHFTDDDIGEVLERAFDAAGGDDVRLGGGASTIRQFLKARLVDEMHFATVPTLLGGGERFFDSGLEGYEVTEFKSSPAVLHIRLSRVPG